MSADANGSATSVAESLRKGFLWNALGRGLPLVIAVLALPIVVSGFGKDRFGVLALIWAVVGYLGLFDLGIGRAITKVVAENIGSGQSGLNAGVLRVGLLLSAAFGIVGAVALAPFVSDGTRALLGSSQDLVNEAIGAITITLVSIPLVTVSSAFRGYLEGYGQFSRVNAVRILLGAGVFLSPLFVMPFAANLVAVSIVLFLVRTAEISCYYVLCHRHDTAFLRPIDLRNVGVRNLLHFGGWISISNVVGPMMVYMDRFAIGALVSASAVTFYVVPYETATKLWLLPAAVATTIFPAMTSAIARRDPQAVNLYASSLMYVEFLLAPFLLVGIAFAEVALRIWLDESFSIASTYVLQCILFGVLLNSVAQIVTMYLHAAGQPKITAQLHILELPLYFGLLFYGIQFAGIDGAAFAWTARVAIDLGLLWWVLLNRFPNLARPTGFSIARIASLFVLCAPCVLLGSNELKFLYLLFLLPLYAFAAIRLLRSQKVR